MSRSIGLALYSRLGKLFWSPQPLPSWGPEDFRMFPPNWQSAWFRPCYPSLSPAIHLNTMCKVLVKWLKCRPLGAVAIFAAMVIPLMLGELDKTVRLLFSTQLFWDEHSKTGWGPVERTLRKCSAPVPSSGKHAASRYMVFSHTGTCGAHMNRTSLPKKCSHDFPYK